MRTISNLSTESPKTGGRRVFGLGDRRTTCEERASVIDSLHFGFAAFGFDVAGGVVAAKPAV